MGYMGGDNTAHNDATNNNNALSNALGMGS